MPAKAGIHDFLEKFRLSGSEIRVPGFRVLIYTDYKYFFFEKKKQKTFGPAGVGTNRASAPRTKRFLVTFFQKSNSFLLTAFR